MGEKDIIEKKLEAYNDVFADIVNALLFNGERVIAPEDLEDQPTIAGYKADGKIRELGRDVAKRWKKQNIRIAFIGLENQTKADRYMTLRVAGYDGVEYRAQMNNLKPGEKPYPVVTLVLYFGYESHWNQPTSLHECLEISERLKPFVNDMKINLFEIAFLSRKQVEMFQSDFRIVADYFVQMRENGDYIPSKEVMDHVQAVLELLNVMAEDKRFELKQNEGIKNEEVRTMADWLTKKLNASRAEGEREGRQEGENRMAKLINLLLNQGRTEDISRVTVDPEYRSQLYNEFQIA